VDAAPHFRKPNMRALFQPDEGWILVDADLSGADAMIVFAEAGEWDTVARLRSGTKLHSETGHAFLGGVYDNAPGDTGNPATLKGKLYADMKGASHGTNYYAGGRTIALNRGWPVAEGDRFKKMWFSLHPGIKQWHERTELELRTTRSTRNPFGYRIHWFDRIDGLMPEALAWQAQSAVAIVTFLAAEKLRIAFPFVQFLIQVHDSLVFQIPRSEAAALSSIAVALEVEVPYSPASLIIPWKLATSEKSWGDCQAWPQKESAI
jgi:DNA polymerase-1